MSHFGFWSFFEAAAKTSCESLLVARRSKIRVNQSQSAPSFADVLNTRVDRSLLRLSTRYWTVIIMTASSSSKKENGGDKKNALEQLREYTVVVADTGDVQAIERLHPVDATTNPSLILKAATMPEYNHLVVSAMEYGKGNLTTVMVSAKVRWNAYTFLPSFHLSQSVCCRISWR
jgi:hypothetical protein